MSDEHLRLQIAELVIEIRRLTDGLLASANNAPVVFQGRVVTNRTELRDLRDWEKPWAKPGTRWLIRREPSSRDTPDGEEILIGIEPLGAAEGKITPYLYRTHAQILTEFEFVPNP